jgi:hypothetical protein
MLHTIINKAAIETNGIQMGRQKILDQMVRGIPQILCALNSSAHAF